MLSRWIVGSVGLVMGASAIYGGIAESAPKALIFGIVVTLMAGDLLRHQLRR